MVSSRKRSQEHAGTRPRIRVLQGGLLCLGVLFCLVAFLLLGSLPSRVQVKQGQISNRTIKADRTVEIIDQQSTNAARRQAANQVEVIYIFDPAASQLAEEKLANTFALAAAIGKVRSQKKPNDSEIKSLTAKIPIALSQRTLEHLESRSEERLEQLQKDTHTVLSRVLEEGVRSDRMAEARRAVRELADDMFRHRSSDEIQAIIEVASESLVPNKNPDFEATRGAQEAAMASIRPIPRVIPEGQVVVREGDPITAEHIRILEALGMTQRHVQYSKIGGYTLLVVMLMALTLGYLRQQRPEIYRDPKSLVLLALIVVFTAAVSRFLVALNHYLAPVAIASILTTVLLEARLAMMITGYMAIYVGVLTADLPAACLGLITGASGILSLARADHRSHLIQATAVVTLTSTTGALIFSLIAGKEWQGTLNDLAFGGLNGLISAALAIGVMPCLEYLFGITTHFRLLDISNPGEPLLQRLLKEAPGTYQHSIMVANLAEAAAQSIGANALKCKVGAYYHDIGKMKRPRFFVENQMGAENPHDRLAPTLSTMIIHSHVKDGIEMARQYKVPDVIIDFIAEHHGTSLVSYFYHQACNRTGEGVYAEDFRYPGPKPQTRETGIVMLCDGIEAAARTMSNPTPEKITELVNKIVKHCLEDGQLDECDLSLKDIQLIRESLIRSLQGIYHTRIEYPEPASLHKSKKVTNLRKKA